MENKLFTSENPTGNFRLWKAIHKETSMLDVNTHIGIFDPYDGKTLSGWLKKNGSNQPQRVSLYHNGELKIKKILDNGHRVDLARTEPGNACFGFRIKIMPDDWHGCFAYVMWKET